MPEPEVIIGYQERQSFEHIIKLLALAIKKKVFIKKTQHAPDKKWEENPRAIPISQVKRGET